MKRLIDATNQERRERIFAILAATSTAEERQELYWQFAQAEMAELNEHCGANIAIPTLGDALKIARDNR